MYRFEVPFRLPQMDKKTGGLIAGLLGGLGTGLGALGTGIGKLGVGFGKGMAALGAGIAGFMLAIGGAAFVLEYAKVDGEAMKKLIQNFFTITKTFYFIWTRKTT